MVIETLKTLYKRDLEKLYQEISSYNSEEALWKVQKAILNSGGNLCLHLIGNLNTYLGATLGKTGYVRNRPLEFSEKDIPKKILLENITETSHIVLNVLNQLSAKDLEEEYPLLVFNEKTSLGYLLIHLSGHLTYHLGQINYHRRLLDIGK